MIACDARLACCCRVQVGEVRRGSGESRRSVVETARINGLAARAVRAAQRAAQWFRHARAQRLQPRRNHRYAVRVAFARAAFVFLVRERATSPHLLLPIDIDAGSSDFVTVCILG